MSNNQENMGNEASSPLDPERQAAVSASGAGDASQTNEASSDISFEPEELTAEEIKALREKAARADENWEKFVRLTADMDNYKKRAARERSEASKYANEALLERLLPVLDNFEAALAAVNNAQTGNLESLKMGIQMIFGQLKSTLADTGLEEIDGAGKKFDPNIHEAVSQQPSDDVPEGQVLQQLRKGYKLRERMLRPAMVVVSRKP